DEESKKPFKCALCGKRFSTSSHLQRHINIHIADDDPNKAKFECGICGRNYNSSNGLAAHKICHLVFFPVA
ncbi:hypothetical protein PENTCL1PPCAC_8462, partial [Pristionchus entomophagus]